MAKRNLPLAATPGTKPRCELHEAALERYVAGLVYALDDSEAPPSQTIDVLEVIGLDFWTGGGVTARRVSQQLKALGEKPVTVNINSPGGDFMEGLAIYNLLRQHPGDVTVRILGEAASAASIVAMAGDRIEIARAAFVFVHNVWTVAAGDANFMEDLVGTLRTFDSVCADLYHARTGQTRAKVQAMMDKETWIGGADAVKLGFADSVFESDKVKAQASADQSPRNKALAALEKILAEHGVSRGERRNLLRIVGTPGAANDTMPGAGGGAKTGTPGAAAAAALRGITTT